MINYDSILSAFDGKPTLLQWLKMVKKALDESVLKNVTITKDGDNISFTFNFEDGTSVTTPKVTLPKGDKGDKGDKGNDGVSVVSFQNDSYKVSGNLTETNLHAVLSNGENKNFVTYAMNGVSITGIDTVGDEVVGDKTLTTLRANYSDSTSDEFVVSAKNGKDASSTGNNIYLHSVKITDDIGNYSIYFSVYSNKETLNLNDALNYIPTSPNDNVLQKNKIPVCFDYSDRVGVLSAVKYTDNGQVYIYCSGVIIENGNPVIKNTRFKAYSITDTLLGENL